MISSSLRLTVEVGHPSEMFLLLEGMADREVPLYGNDREAHDLYCCRQRVGEGLRVTEASV